MPESATFHTEATLAALLLALLTLALLPFERRRVLLLLPPPRIRRELAANLWWRGLPWRRKHPSASARAAITAASAAAILVSHLLFERCGVFLLLPPPEVLRASRAAALLPSPAMTASRRKAALAALLLALLTFLKLLLERGRVFLLLPPPRVCCVAPTDDAIRIPGAPRTLLEGTATLVALALADLCLQCRRVLLLTPPLGGAPTLAGSIVGGCSRRHPPRCRRRPRLGQVGSRDSSGRAAAVPPLAPRGLPRTAAGATACLSERCAQVVPDPPTRPPVLRQTTPPVAAQPPGHPAPQCTLAAAVACFLASTARRCRHRCRHPYPRRQ